MSRYPNAAAQGGWVGVSKHTAELGVLMQTARRFADWNIAHGAIRCGGQGTRQRHFPFSIFNFPCERWCGFGRASHAAGAAGPDGGAVAARRDAG